MDPPVDNLMFIIPMPPFIDAVIIIIVNLYNYCYFCFIIIIVAAAIMLAVVVEMAAVIVVTVLCFIYNPGKLHRHGQASMHLIYDRSIALQLYYCVTNFGHNTSIPF